MSNRKADVHLKDGAVLRGKVLSVTPEGLTIVIDKVVAKGTPGIHAIGESHIPRESIMRLKMDRAGKRGRIICTSIGAALGLGMGYYAQDDAQAVAGYGAGPAAIGYLLGWLIDRRSVTFEIAPKP
jgi:hypothetical protein